MDTLTPTAFGEVLRDSGLIAEADLASYLAGRPESAKILAGRLVAGGLLTDYQASRLLAGKSRGFVLARRYKVLRPLGEGGMGQVFLAEQAGLRRLVALKVLPPKFAADPVAVARFDREALAAAALDHPNIVRVHDTGEDAGVHFLVMEYVAGSPLSAVVAKAGPLPFDAACDYIRQAALGLANAHERGLAHRDIKPANLLVTSDGTVKVLDLGLARFVEDGDGLTRQHNAGDILGTADYMAPEQAVDAAEAGTPADIYSLGCTLHFLLVGKAPFAGMRTAHKLMAHQSRTPELPTGLPPGVVTVLRAMTAKRPEDRPTAAQTAALLAPLSRRTPPPCFDISTPLPGFSPTERIGHSAAPSGSAMHSTTTVLHDPFADDGRSVVLAARHRAAKAADRPYALYAAFAMALAGLAGGGAFLWLHWKPSGQIATNTDDGPDLPLPTARSPRDRNSHAEFLADLAREPVTRQAAGVMHRLKTLNPDMDPWFEDQVRDGRVYGLRFNGRDVKDISPIAALSGLEELVLNVVPGEARSGLTDLRPLSTLPLRSLHLSGHRELRDISPLAALRLEALDLSATAIEDISPLRGIDTLKTINLRQTKIKDTSPLAGRRWEWVSVAGTRGLDHTFLRGTPLREFHADWSDFRDTSLLAGAPLEVLNALPSGVTDIGPLAGKPLKRLDVPFEAIAARPAVIASLKQLESLNAVKPDETLRWVTPEAGILFRDDFDGDGPRGWKIPGGPWKVEARDGHDRCLIGPPGNLAWAETANEYDDCEVAAWIHLGQTDTKPALFARHTDDGKSFRHYALHLDTSHEHNIRWNIALDDNGWKPIAEGAIPRPGSKWVWVRFRLEGPVLSAAISEDGINYRALGSGNNTALKKGTAGLGRFASGEVAFDGFSIFALPKPH